MSQSADTVQANLELNLDGDKFTFTASVPKGPATVRELLPILREFTHGVVNAGVARVAAEGKEVSCKAGCGACCCQLVPVSRSEAFVLRDVVAAQPEPRRLELLARFAAAKAKLVEAGIYDALSAGKLDELGGARAFGFRYFQLGIACPFLQEQSCSIYADRPLKCREYLVTSPAERCAKPHDGGIEGVPVSGRPANAAMRVGDDGAKQRWVPLIVALDWAASHSPDAAKPGTALFEEFLKRFLESDNSSNNVSADAT